MNDMKAGPIALIALIFAGIGVTVTMMRSGSTPLPQQVEEYLETSKKQTPQERHSDVAKQIETLQAMVDDPVFTKLPAKQQEMMRAHLTELTQYRSFVEQIDKITPPRDVRRDDQLQAVKKSLSQLKAPIEYQVEWSQTEAGERQRQWLEDIEALERAVDAVEKGYQKVNAEADALNVEAANLPARAGKILDDAAKLPSPETDAGKKVPGAQTVTYGTVFVFPRVDFVLDKWKKKKQELLKIKSLGK